MFQIELIGIVSTNLPTLSTDTIVENMEDDIMQFPGVTEVDVTDIEFSKSISKKKTRT